jgi:hypothetical protein
MRLVICLLLLLGSAGCELVADFDRSKIPVAHRDAGPARDAGHAADASDGAMNMPTSRDAAAAGDDGGAESDAGR